MMEGAVERKRLLTKEDLIEHIKEIGQTILFDAENIAIDPQNVRSFHIEATIAPGEKATNVTYTVNRFADPRIRKARTINE